MNLSLGIVRCFFFIKAASSDPAATITGSGILDVSSGAAAANVTVVARDGISTMNYIIEVTVDKQNKSGNISSEIKLKLYPNPFSEGFYLIAPEGSNYSISDLSGRLVRSGVSKGFDRIGEELVKGLYTLTIRTENSTKSISLLKI